MIRRPLTSLKLKQADIEQMEQELEKKRKTSNIEEIPLRMEIDAKNEDAGNKSTEK